MPKGFYKRTIKDRKERIKRLKKFQFKKDNSSWLNIKGKNHPAWKGGRIKFNRYVYIYKPNHPFNRKNYIAEHRFVMEKNIKRYLKVEEVVHHINGNVSDNRIKNLKLYANNSEHSKNEFKFHRTIRRK